MRWATHCEEEEDEDDHHEFCKTDGSATGSGTGAGGVTVHTSETGVTFRESFFHCFTFTQSAKEDCYLTFHFSEGSGVLLHRSAMTGC